MDREKVNGFELCANGELCTGEKFMKCPFSPRNNAEQNCGVTMARYILELLKEQEEREKAICKEICDFIRGACSTDTDDDKDFVCYEIQRCFTHFGRSVKLND